MITSLQILPIAFLPTYRLTSWLLKPCFSKLGNGIPFRQNEQLTTIASILFGFQPHGADYFQRTFTGPAWNEGPRLLSTQVLSLLPATESGAKPSNARFPPAWHSRTSLQGRWDISLLPRQLSEISFPGRNEKSTFSKGGGKPPTTEQHFQMPVTPVCACHGHTTSAKIGHANITALMNSYF